MQACFDRPEVNVGDIDAISGVIDVIPYNLWGMKELDYVMCMMTSGGALSADDWCKETTCWWTEGNQNRTATFWYAQPFDWHFCYRHAVDYHNNLRHALPSIEDLWTTTCWESCVFEFILALMEVNAFLSLRYFTFAKSTIEGCPTLFVFCHKVGLATNQQHVDSAGRGQ